MATVRFASLILVLMALLSGFGVRKVYGDDRNGGTLVLVVNRQNPVSSLSRREIIDIYMGRYRIFPDGMAAIPIDMEDEQEQFYRRLIDKTPAEVNAYWARLVFSGKATPPIKVRNSREMAELISNNINAIGYISEQDANNRLKVLMRLEVPDMAMSTP